MDQAKKEARRIGLGVLGSGCRKEVIVDLVSKEEILLIREDRVENEGAVESREKRGWSLHKCHRLNSRNMLKVMRWCIGGRLDSDHKTRLGIRGGAFQAARRALLVRV